MTCEADPFLSNTANQQAIDLLPKEKCHMDPYRMLDSRMRDIEKGSCSNTNSNDTMRSSSAMVQRSVDDDENEDGTGGDHENSSDADDQYGKKNTEIDDDDTNEADSDRESD